MKIILLGPSGAGKGTLAENIQKDYKLAHISTGIIFRKNISDKTELGVIAKKHMMEGSWVPDDLTLNMLTEPFKQAKNGFILDGYPRTLNQAKLLSAKIKEAIIIELSISDEIVVDRLGGRFFCPKCEKNYNTKFGKVDNCTACKTILIQREDDKPETIRNRLRSYYKEATAMSNFYKEHGNLIKIEVTENMSPDDVYSEVKPHIAKVSN